MGAKTAGMKFCKTKPNVLWTLDGGIRPAALVTVAKSHRDQMSCRHLAQVAA